MISLLLILINFFDLFNFQFLSLFLKIKIQNKLKIFIFIDVINWSIIRDFVFLSFIFSSILNVFLKKKIYYYDSTFLIQIFEIEKIINVIKISKNMIKIVIKIWFVNNYRFYNVQNQIAIAIILCQNSRIFLNKNIVNNQ